MSSLEKEIYYMIKRVEKDGKMTNETLNFKKEAN